MGDTGSLSMKRTITSFWDSERKREMLLQHNVIHSEGCAVDSTESKKARSLSKKLVLPPRTDSMMDTTHRHQHFSHSHSKLTCLAGIN